MKLTRIFALVLVLVMALGIFAGCQQTTNPTTKPNSGNNVTNGNDGTTAGSTSNLPDYLNVGQFPLVDEGTDITLKIAIRCHDNTQDPEKTWQYAYLQKAAGCKIEIVEYAGGTDVATQISATIAAQQELPDILWGVSINKDTIYTYGEEGYFANLRSYYEDQEGASKTFWDRIQVLTEDEQELIIQMVRSCFE